MSEWWTYRLSDFLLFAPRTWYRLIERYNLELWPAQLAALGVALALVALAWRGTPRAARPIAFLLAAAWAFVAWRFHWQTYATINWAATWFAAAFGAQAALLAVAGLRRGLAYDGAARGRRIAGLALAIFALAVQPGVALALGRPPAQLEAALLAPDPTALLTLALLVAARRAHWSLYALPFAWCAVSTLTLTAMEAADALVPALGALTALGAALALRPPRTPPATR